MTAKSKNATQKIRLRALDERNKMPQLWRLLVSIEFLEACVAAIGAVSPAVISALFPLGLLGNFCDSVARAFVEIAHVAFYREELFVEFRPVPLQVLKQHLQQKCVAVAALAVAPAEGQRCKRYAWQNDFATGPALSP